MDQNSTIIKRARDFLPEIGDQFHFPNGKHEIVGFRIEPRYSVIQRLFNYGFETNALGDWIAYCRDLQTGEIDTELNFVGYDENIKCLVKKKDIKSN